MGSFSLLWLLVFGTDTGFYFLRDGIFFLLYLFLHCIQTAVYAFKMDEKEYQRRKKFFKFISNKLLI